MANKFTEQRKKRSSANATEEIAEKLYENEELIKEHVKEEVRPSVIKPDKPVEKPLKRGKGRPKKAEDEKELSSTYSLLLSESIREKMRLAASARNMSVKKYVVMLIEDDYAKYEEKYETFKEMTEKLGF